MQIRNFNLTSTAGKIVLAEQLWDSISKKKLKYRSK